MDRKNYDNKAALAKKRKRRRTILHSTVGILFISTVLVVLSVVFCRVAKFTVAGESPYSRDDIVNSVKACEGKSMFLIKTEKLEDLVESALPYTDNVTISKQYPRGLRIEVSTAKKAFSVELSKNCYAVTNGRLKVLEATDKLPEDTVTVKEESRARLVEAFERAYRDGNGILYVEREAGSGARGASGKINRIACSEKPGCPDCGWYMDSALNPKHFSFNTHWGACETCLGLGHFKDGDVCPDCHLL